MASVASLDLLRALKLRISAFTRDDFVQESCQITIDNSRLVRQPCTNIWRLFDSLPRNSASRTVLVLELVPTAVVLEGSSRAGKSWIQTQQHSNESCNVILYAPSTQSRLSKSFSGSGELGPGVKYMTNHCKEHLASSVYLTNQGSAG